MLIVLLCVGHIGRSLLFVRYLMTEFLSDKFHRTHVFSSFFYRRLTQKPSRRHKEEEDVECTRFGSKAIKASSGAPFVDSLYIRLWLYKSRSLTRLRLIIMLCTLIGSHHLSTNQFLISNISRHVYVY